jgi:hypothetical protein
MGVFKFHDFTLLLQKLQQHANIGNLLSLFRSGRITLKVIFYYFHHYLFKIYIFPRPHFEKPNRVLFQQYSCTPLSLHLGQWHIANETESLIQLHYARIKRNPE